MMFYYLYSSFSCVFIKISISTLSIILATVDETFLMHRYKQFLSTLSECAIVFLGVLTNLSNTMHFSLRFFAGVFET